MPIGEFVFLVFFSVFFLLSSHCPGVAWSSPHTYLYRRTHATHAYAPVRGMQCFSTDVLPFPFEYDLLASPHPENTLAPKTRPVLPPPSLAQPFPLVRRAAPSVGPSRSTYIERYKTAYPPTLLIGSLAETDAPTTHLGVKLFSLFTFSLSWFARFDPPPPPYLFYLLFVSFVCHATLLCLILLFTYEAHNTLPSTSLLFVYRPLCSPEWWL